MLYIRCPWTPAALQKIDAMDWEANEWDAVEKYRDCQKIAKDALSDDEVSRG